MRVVLCFLLASTVTAPSICHAQAVQPIGHWVFDQAGVRDGAVRDLADRHDATITGKISLVHRPVGALTLDGNTTSVEVQGIVASQLPQEQISVEAWVCLNQGTKWGGLAGYIQDNGSYEKGWLLGYNASQFNFSVSIASKLPYLPSKTEFQAGTWYHVTGTYDGAQLKIYVNGQLENSMPASGPIAYPPQATLTMGAYHDQDEFYRGDGMLHEVRLYNRALSAADVQAQYEAKSQLFPQTVDLALGPYLQYVTQSTAHVYWETEQPCSSAIEFGLGRLLDRHVEDPTATTNHKIALTDLQPNAIYNYRIRHSLQQREVVSKEYRFDTAMNYTLPDWPNRPSPYVGEPQARNLAEAAERIVATTGISKGYCLLLGCDDGQLAYELARRTELRITCVDTDPERLRRVADRMMKCGIYGWRVSVRRVDEWDKLPFTKHFANLVVSETVATAGKCPVDESELARILRPAGGVAYLGPFRKDDEQLQSREVERLSQPASIDVAVTEATDGRWARFERRPLSGAGQWTHQYGHPDNSSNSCDDLQGACETGHLEVQWLGRPGADFGADRNPRMPAPLAVSGRLFHQGLDRIAALDAYNGAILWSLEVPGMLRVNMPRDASAWCADENSLYVAIRDKCWRLDAKTGNRTAIYGVVKNADGPQDLQWGYVGNNNGKLYGSAIRQGSVYKNIWGGGGEGWYDGTSGPTTAKVCSELLFALQPDSGECDWTYQNGAIINTTITIGGGRVYFVECRHPALAGESSGRIGLPELWEEQYLVALDADSGEKLWEQSIDTADGIVVFYLSYGDERLFITSSGSGKYELNAYDAGEGEFLWDVSHAWTANNHGGHMQHPVVMQETIYLEPCVYRVEDGSRISDQMGRHAGCATYVGTAGALIYRGEGRRIAMWDFNSGKSTFWDSLRPSCWLSTIAAGGMVLSPEGGGGCSCANWLQTSLGFVSSDREGGPANDE